MGRLFLGGLIVVAAVAAGVTPAVAGSRPHADVSAFLRFETDPAVFGVLYRYGQVTPASSGAYGPNATDSRSAWYLEYQRAGATDVIDGVVRPDQDPALVALGLKMFHFGLARQAADGSFPGSAWPFHGTAMFLSEAGPALLLLRTSSLADQFDGETRWEIARMQRAAYAMIRSVGGPGQIDDYSKNHRRFEAAIALGSVGALAGDRTLVRWSRLYAWQGIRTERPDGVMPENGGHDSGYQALGMVNATRYLELIARGSLQRALYRALDRGERWELSRVRPDGSIDQTGDTRTVGCHERDPMGACKTVFYAPIFSALARWGAITGGVPFKRAAHEVWQHSGYGGRAK